MRELVGPLIQHLIGQRGGERFHRSVRAGHCHCIRVPGSLFLKPVMQQTALGWNLPIPSGDELPRRDVVDQFQLRDRFLRFVEGVVQQVFKIPGEASNCLLAKKLGVVSEGPAEFVLLFKECQGEIVVGRGFVGVNQFGGQPDQAAGINAGHVLVGEDDLENG